MNFIHSFTHSECWAEYFKSTFVFTVGDAMRIISAGGFFLNYRRVLNFDEVLVPGLHILPNKISLARVGKKNYYVIKWSP
jgi:tyrosyl-tRNA synthetase